MTWRAVPARPYPEGLPTLKPEDYQYFAPLLKETEDEELSLEEQKERKIMKMLLKAGWCDTKHASNSPGFASAPYTKHD
jgi:hypothetical protein